jgi:hypothetical protein
MAARAATAFCSRWRAEAMATPCPYCLRENPELALVCITCSRDIAVPEALAAERLDLLGKRDVAQAELLRITSEIAAIRTARTGGPR